MRNYVRLMFLSIFGLILLSGSGCTTQPVNVNTNTSNTNITTTNSNTNVINTNTTMDTTEWLTYENPEYGFSFKYPKEWDFLTGREFTAKFGIPESLAISGFDHHPSYETIRGVFAIYFNVVPIEKTISLKDWFESTDSYTSEGELKQNLQFTPSIDSLDITIDGIDGIDQITTGEGGGMREVFIRKSDYVYIFTISVNGDNPNYRDPSLNSNINGNKVLESFNQLLGTVHFQ